jgi:hypothetical protein
MYLIGLVDSTLYRYINGMLIYSRDKWTNSGLTIESQMEESFNTDITILNITQVDFKEKEDLYEDPVLKRELIDLIKLCSKLEISVGRFGRKLSERLENFSEGFQEDLNEYLLETLKIDQNVDLVKCFEQIEVKYFVKLALVYFGILKNVFSKLV